MKPMLTVAMFFVWLGCAFGIDSGESIKADPPVITGGWHEMDISEFDESLTDFIMDYLDGAYAHPLYTDATRKSTMLAVERGWTQLVQGRRFLLAYYYHVYYFDENDSPAFYLQEISTPIIGLLMLRRDSNGVLTVEKDYATLLDVLDFIELILTGENKEREPKTLIKVRGEPKEEE